MMIFSQIQINIVLSILLIVLLVHAFSNMNTKKITNKLFMWFIGLVCVILLLEVLSVLLSNSNLKQFKFFNILVNMFGFGLTPCIPFLGYLFSKAWINRYEKVTLMINKIFLLPLLINIILTLLSYIGTGYFNITKDNIYERGPLFFIFPLVNFIYVLFSLRFIYYNRKKFTPSEIFVLISLYIVPVIFTCIQIRYIVYLTTWNSLAIIVVITYIFILNDQAFHDSLTGLWNRLAYEHYIENITNKKLANLTVIYIDIDSFKLINDTYGHYEGDEAIKVFSNLLVKNFPIVRKRIIRLGGDEFIIFLENHTNEKIDVYIKNLTQQVKNYNLTSKKTYNLNFSYGRSGYNTSFNNIYELLEHADQLMYAQKQSRKSTII